MNGFSRKAAECLTIRLNHDGYAYIIITATVIIGTLMAYLLCSYHPVIIALMMLALTALVVIMIVPYLGLGLLGFTLPFTGLLQLMPNAFTASKLLAAFLAVSFVMHLIIKTEVSLLVPSKSFIYYLALPFWCLMTLPFSIEPGTGFDSLSSILLVAGLAYLAASIPASVHQLKVVCFASTLGAACLGIYIMIWGIDGLTRDYSVRLSAGTNENVLAHALAVGLLLSLFIVRDSRWRTIALVLFLDAFILYAIVLTGSRGTWVALAICLLVPLGIIRGITFGKRLALFVVVGLVMAMSIYVITQNMFGLSEKIAERLYDINAGEEASGGRLEYIWPSYIKSFIESPIVGSGLGLRAFQWKASHNDIIYITATLGIIGILIYAMMWINLLKEALSNSDLWMRITVTIIITFLFFAGMTHDTIWLKSNAFALGIVFCANAMHITKDHSSTL